MVIKNLHGIVESDFADLSNYEYLNSIHYKDRSTTTGQPTKSYLYPNFSISYGISNPLIRFQNPESPTQSNFANDTPSA